MKTMYKQTLTLIVALAAVATLSPLTLTAAEPAPSPKAACTQCQTRQAVSADPDLLARNPAIAASPKTLANFPQLAKVHTPQPNQALAACACCKR
jgi:hypothetical protein